MILIVAIFMLGVLALRMGDGSISFIIGIIFLISSISMMLNTAIHNPKEIPYKEEIAKISHKTRQVTKQLKDEIDKVDKNVKKQKSGEK